VGLGLNSILCLQTGSLPLKPHFQSILLWLFWARGLENLISVYQVARITAKFIFLISPLHCSLIAWIRKHSWLLCIHTTLYNFAEFIYKLRFYLFFLYFEDFLGFSVHEMMLSVKKDSFTLYVAIWIIFYYFFLPKGFG
jgi:hypothetical protein